MSGMMGVGQKILGSQGWYETTLLDLQFAPSTTTLWARICLWLYKIFLAWSVVVDTIPRNLYEIPENEEKPYQEK